MYEREALPAKQDQNELGGPQIELGHNMRHVWEQWPSRVGKQDPYVRH